MGGILRWKGELADGEVHMTAQEYSEHKVAEDHEKKRQLLRKMANNPILNREAQAAIRYAIFCLDEATWWRKQYLDIREMCDNMKKKQNVWREEV